MQGAYNGYAGINAFWPDTTLMDNIHGAADGVAGTLEDETGGNTVHTDSNTAETDASNNQDNGASG